MRSYIGLIHKAADGDFGVSFPDFPNVTATGATLDDARAVAEEALARHVWLARRSGSPPRSRT
jgi:predicted RNase H-like HicB family nuclease